MSENNFIPMLKDQCEVSQTQSVYNAFDIYLDEEIKDPTYYRQAFQVLRSAQRGDLVRLYISSHGGNLNSALIFKNCIENCEADVVAIIEAEAYSAASLIALSAPNIEVKPYATMMLHSASFGSGGSVQNVRDHVEFTGRHAESLMDEVYRDFISEEEMLDLKKGRELWFDYKEISERLDKMFGARGDECSCGECDLDSDDEPKLDLFGMIKEAVREVLGESKPVPEATEKPKRPSRAKKVIEKPEDILKG